MKKKRKTVPARSSTAVSVAPGDSTPAPTKKRKPVRRAAVRGKRGTKRLKQVAESDSDDDDDDEDEESEQSNDDDPDEDVDVDFELFNPDFEDPGDFHSVSELLKNGLFDFVELNFSELADCIVNQGNIGSLVKSNANTEDCTVSGLLTALNLRQFEKLSWTQDVKKALVDKAKKFAEPGVAKAFEAVIDRKDAKVGEVGLLIAERFANLPPQLLPPLHQALHDDITWSCSTPECPPEERPFYKFSHFIGIARCKSNVGGDAGAAAPGGKKKKRKLQAPGDSGTTASDLIYPQAELEIYMRRATLSFTFPCSTEKRRTSKAMMSKPGGQEKRAVFVIPRKALEEVAVDLKKNFVKSQGLE